MNPQQRTAQALHLGAVSRSLMAFGLAVPIGVVFSNPEVIALDTGHSLERWYVVAAGAVGFGLVISMVLARLALNRNASVGLTVGILSLLSGAAWMALANTGDPNWVDALVAGGIATAVPAITIGAVDALASRPRERPIDAIGQPATAAAAGLALGAFAVFADPTVLWSWWTLAGGFVAFGGSLLRLFLGHIDAVPRVDPLPATSDITGNGIRFLMAAVLGLAASSAVRVQPYLLDEWDAGVRYQAVTVVLVGLATASMVLAFIWLPQRFQRSGSSEVNDVAGLALLVGVTLLIVAISETLPGTVIGAGAASGLAGAGVVLLAAGGARAGRPEGAITLAATASGAFWVVGWSTWPYVADFVGNERYMFALVGLPALVAGVVLALRPVGTAVDETGPVTAVAEQVLRRGGPIRRPLLEAKGVEFSYGSVQVLFGVDLEVHDGEVVALLGTNGAGKTTFLRTIAGLGEPSAGTVKLSGGDLAPFSASDRVQLGVNQIATGAAVAPDLTVAENLAMFGHTLRKANARAGRDRAVEVFPRLGERLNQKASSLSGGERQMLSLSKSLVLRPRLLIIDECTLGLAPIAVAQLVPVIRRLHQEGSSILLVEQSVHLALDLADRAYCMEKGRIVYESGADALRADPGLLEAVYLEGITVALEKRQDLSAQAPNGAGT